MAYRFYSNSLHCRALLGYPELWFRAPNGTVVDALTEGHNCIGHNYIGCWWPSNGGCRYDRCCGTASGTAMAAALDLSSRFDRNQPSRL